MLVNCRLLFVVLFVLFDYRKGVKLIMSITQSLMESLQEQLERIKRICNGVEQFVESSNNALEILEGEMKRLKAVGSLDDYDTVKAKYLESKKDIKGKAQSLTRKLKSFEKNIKKMPNKPIKMLMIAELNKAKKKLKTIQY